MKNTDRPDFELFQIVCRWIDGKATTDEIREAMKAAILKPGWEHIEHGLRARAKVEHDAICDSCFHYEMSRLRGEMIAARMGAAFLMLTEKPKCPLSRAAGERVN